MIDEPSVSKIIVDAKTLENMFLALSKKKLEHFSLTLRPTVNEATSGEQLEELQRSFT